MKNKVDEFILKHFYAVNAVAFGVGLAASGIVYDQIKKIVNKKNNK